MSLPPDYVERVYAGVLGKLIGVYLGRPFEGWSYERIMAELGQIEYYVNDRFGVPLVVTDDDISGTFTFLRALPDYGNTRTLTPAQIGQSWLNYIVERRSILWWGGLGNSTEHTAYLRLKRGIPAPRSGSIALNGQVVAEQIGSQIFIDGWAMVAPGDPELAADLAGRAASVSHDGAAIHGAQVLAAMEAAAFVESDIERLLDVGLSVLPPDSLIARLIRDVRAWHAEEPDWHAARARIAGRYGYDRYGGNCHMVPNHALIILGLLYGEGDLQRSLMIVNSAGWDTDCNSGNLGCLLGIRGGLATIDAGPDWRGPIADRLYLATADGGRAITDAVRETYYVVNSGRALAGEAPLAPKNGARFHFELPGSVQGWQADQQPESRGTLDLENVPGHSQYGARSLAMRYRHLAPGREARAATATFIPPEAITMSGYTLLASPTLYPGQTLRAVLESDIQSTGSVTVRLCLGVYGKDDTLGYSSGPEVVMQPGARHEITWRVPETNGAPIAQVGIAVRAHGARADGALYLDYLTWDGIPDATFIRPEAGTMWRRAWIDGADQFDWRWPESFRIAQNEGRGMLITGTREWTDYRVTADVTPHLAAAAGIGARVQGLRRYYALLLRGGGIVQLVKVLDGETVLAEAAFPWQVDVTYMLSLEVQGNQIAAEIDGDVIFKVDDQDHPLEAGGVALICEEGMMASQVVRVQPVT